MKYVGYILIGWIVWFAFYFPISEIVEDNKLKEEIEGNYTSTSMILNSRVYFTKNMEITFKDGKYHVHYDKYARCYTFNYWGNLDNISSYTCADNVETFIETVDGDGTYQILNDEELLLKFGSGSRRCDIRKNRNTIDCTKSGGWIYTKE